MNETLDRRLKDWLQKTAKRWNMTINEAARRMAWFEIDNRESWYPEVRIALSRRPLDFARFVSAAHETWALGHKIGAIRFNQFVEKQTGAQQALKLLAQDFPYDKAEAIGRIDRFVERAIELGYRNPKGGADRAGAALLASVVLTSVYPNRYVDFRKNRWTKFVGVFGLSLPAHGANYGELLTWAAECGKALTNTPTFQQYWGNKEALWAISGICWVGPSPKKPDVDIDFIDDESYAEGAIKRRLHHQHERNRMVVSKAKNLAWKRNPVLPCDVCGFSFSEVYGKRGEKFIEAHHRQPVAELEPGSRTRVKDISLLCANCHRIIHRGSHTLTIDELHQLLQGSEHQ